ncbi:FecR family protein [Rhizobium sp. PP-F2F-G36]|nr:FecR family protein [Rhizobium sp. PP-CC-2G-626]TCQ08967.1 FecR family protein [Rhizobium sp. PP-F2F-G36]
MKTNPPFPEATLGEATDWFLEMRNRPDCLETQAAFQQWLSASDENTAAWHQVEKTWALLGETRPVHAADWERAATGTAAVVPFTAKQSEPRRNRLAGAALLAAAACAVAFLAGPALLLHLRADEVTASGESRRVVLADGTTVDMSGGTAFAVTIDKQERHVELLKGEAFFDVTHDAGRPFTVDANGVTVTVLGTAFDLQTGEQDTTVELARGSVAISYDGASQRSTFELSPGETAAIDRGTGTAIRGKADIEEMGAWRSGKLSVDNVTIASAIERIQRHHPAWITIADGTLGSLRVTGLYDLRDPDRALNALVRPFGGKVRAVTPYARIVSRY